MTEVTHVGLKAERSEVISKVSLTDLNVLC